jgi:hypothetical protein
MTNKRKYLVKKVAAEGEDVKADAGKFDCLLDRLLHTDPLPLAKLREEPGRLAARRPRKSGK